MWSHPMPDLSHNAISINRGLMASVFFATFWDDSSIFKVYQQNGGSNMDDYSDFYEMYLALIQEEKAHTDTESDTTPGCWGRIRSLLPKYTSKKNSQRNM